MGKEGSADLGGRL